MKARLILTMMVCVFAGSAAAQWLPTRPVRMLLAYPPGAANDSNARAVAARLTDIFKQQVIVDNRPGANGIVATTVLARAAPDGHTLMSMDVAHAANPALYDKISVVAGMPMAQSGRARALGVSSAQRMPQFPDLPTIAEAGVPGFEFYLWQGVIGPAGLPRPVVSRFNSEINNVLANAEFKERMTQAGNELTGGTPQQAAEFIRAEVARWKKIIKPEMRLSR